MGMGGCAFFCLLFASDDYPTFPHGGLLLLHLCTTIAHGALSGRTELARGSQGDAQDVTASIQV
jgi:hypothetical protein